MSKLESSDSQEESFKIASSDTENKENSGSCLGCRLSGFATLSTIGLYLLYETRGYKVDKLKEQTPKSTPVATLKTDYKVLFRKQLHSLFDPSTQRNIQELSPNSIKFMRGMGFSKS